MKVVVLFMAGLLSLGAQTTPVEGGLLTPLGGQGLNKSKIFVAVGNEKTKAVLTSSAIWSQAGTGAFEILIANGDKRLGGTVIQGQFNPGLSVGSSGAVYFDSFYGIGGKGAASWRAFGGSITKLITSGVKGIVKLRGGGQVVGNIISVSQANEAPDGTLYLAVEFGPDAQNPTDWFICSLASDGTLSSVVHDTAVSSVPGNPGLAIGVRGTHQVLTFAGSSMFFWRNAALCKVDLLTGIETTVMQAEMTTVGATNIGEGVFPGYGAYALNAGRTGLEYVGYGIYSDAASGINGITRLLRANAGGNWQLPAFKVGNLQTDAIIDVVRLDDQAVVLPYVTHLTASSSFKGTVAQQLNRFEGLNFPGKTFANEGVALPDGIIPFTFPAYVAETCGFWFVAADINGYTLGTYRYASVCLNGVSELEGVSTLTGNNLAGMRLFIDGATYPPLSTDNTTMTFLAPTKGSHTLRLIDASGSVTSKELIFTSLGSILLPPMVFSFTAEPSTINAGESSNLCWVIQGNVQGTTLDQNIGTVQPYLGCKSVSPAATTTYTLTTQGTNGLTTKVATLVTVKLVPMFTADSVVNAASSKSPCTPGSVCTMYGANLATATAVANGTPLPRQLAGAQVLINNVAAPLFYASPTQVNFQMPFEASGSTATIQGVTEQGASSTVTIPLATAPGLFLGDAGSVLMQDAGGRLITSATAEDVVVIYATGMGAIKDCDIHTGERTPLALCPTLETPEVTIGNEKVPVLFSGLTPNSVGLYQLNLIVPGKRPADMNNTVTLPNVIVVTLVGQKASDSAFMPIISTL